MSIVLPSMSAGAWECFGKHPKIQPNSKLSGGAHPAQAFPKRRNILFAFVLFAFVCALVASMAVVAETFSQWLAAVDDQPQWPPKPAEFLKKVESILGALGVEITAPVDLCGANVDMITNAIGTSVSARVYSFIQRVLAKATRINNSTVMAEQMKSQQEHFSEVLANQFGKKKVTAKKVHFMLGQHIDAITLRGLSQEFWPVGAAMDSAASQGVYLLAKLEEAGSKRVTEPFVHVDLRDFKPHWCKVGEAAPSDSEDELEASKGFKALASALGAQAKKKQRQPVVRWSVAFDKWAIFAAARGHLILVSVLLTRRCARKLPIVRHLVISAEGRPGSHL